MVQMNKEIITNDYKLEGVVIGDSTINLENDKESFLIKTRSGTKNMDVRLDNITNVYLK